MRVRPRVRWLCALLVLAALAQPTAATAQQPDTGTTDSSDPAPAEPFRVTIDAPAKGSPIAPSGDISFSANKPGAAFTCQLGAAARGSCTSPVHYGPLPPGQQLPFAVFALLPGAHSSSADRTVYTIAQVETTPLEVTITSAPSGEVNEKAATISFTANRSEAAFRCTLDGVAAPCSSPRQYRDLSAGTHAFTVVAVAGKETSKAKSASWTVAAVGPPSQGPPQAGTTSAPEGTSPETSPPPSATDGGSNWLVVVALVVLGALVAAMLLELLRRMARARRRATWQLDARPESPERPCSKRSHYCQKTQVELKPGRRLIAYLAAEARDEDHTQLATHIAGRIVSELNRALRDHERSEDRDRLRTTLVPVAGLLVREIELWLGDDAVHHNVAVDAHLIAAEMEYEFALYCCKSREGGPEWEKEDEWTAAVEDESEENAVRLDRAEPLDARAQSATDQLTEFIMKLDQPTRGGQHVTRQHLRPLA